jgi:hypothetical protein
MIFSLLISTGGVSLAKPVSFVCHFSGVREPITYIVDSLTLDKGGNRTATMVGNNGTASVFTMAGTDAVSFIEPVQSGAAHMTTIAKSGTAIYSRHTLIAGQFVHSQNIGKCDFRD